MSKGRSRGVSNVGLFVGYLIKGSSVRKGPNRTRRSIHFYRHWPIHVRLYFDQFWRLSGHGIATGSQVVWDGVNYMPQPIITTVFRVGPLAIIFGPEYRR